MDFEILKLLDSNLKENDKKNNALWMKKQSISESGLDLSYLEIKIKEWIQKYSSSDIIKKPVLTDHNKFYRLKIFIDFCDLLLTNPQILEKIYFDFFDFTKQVNLLVKKLLVNEFKFDIQTKILSDIIVLNYPFIKPVLTYKELNEIFNNYKNESRILGYQKASVLRVNPSTNFLWYKKFFYNCDCFPTNNNSFNKIRNKYFSTFKSINQIENNENMNKNKGTFCKKCGKSFYHDKNSDIYIECQEIIISVETENNFYMKNIFSLWLFSDFINSVKEGDFISFVAFYQPLSTKYFLEKEYKYGNLVVLNMNFCFKNLGLLNEKLFCKYEKSVTTKEKMFKAKSNVVYPNQSDIEKNYKSLINVKFFQNCSNVLYKFLTVYSFESEKSLFMKNIPIHYNFILKLLLDISIVQRDFINQSYKLAFFETTKTGKVSYEDNLLKSGSICFNTKIFDKQKSSQRKSINELKKFFRLTKQIEDNEYQDNIFNRPLNLFLVFEDLKIHFEVFKAYTNNENFKIYPFFSSANNFNQLINYFISNNFNIILIPNVEFLSKLEIEIINSIIKSKDIELQNNTSVKLNITFWFCISSKKYLSQNNNKGKNAPLYTFCLSNLNKNFELILEGCDLVFNLSSQFNKIRGIELEIMQHINEDKIETLYKNHDDIAFKKDIFSDKIAKSLMIIKLDKIFTNKTICNDHLEFSEEINNPYLSARIIEDYFLVKREINNIQFNDIFVLLRIACSISIIRKQSFNDKIYYPKTIHSLSIVDSLLSIILYEETISCKKGLEYSSFGNITAKFLLNISNETLRRIINNIGEKSENLQEICNSPKLPKTKVSRKKIALENNRENNKESKEITCLLCERIEKEIDEKFIIFLEKVFTLIVNENK